MYLEKPICHEHDLRFRNVEIIWEKRDGLEHCNYCGSLNPKELVRLRDEGKIRDIHQADWKYGYPHKFYIDSDGIHAKFYTRHLQELVEQPEFEIIADILKCAGVIFEKRDGEVYYRGLPR